MSIVTIQPELASLVSGRIFANVPDTRILFAEESLEFLDGSDLEKLMMAAFLMGYGDGVNDAADFAFSNEQSELMKWAEKQL